MKEYKTIREILDDLINREIGKSEAEVAIKELINPKSKMIDAKRVREMEVIGFQDMRKAGISDEARLILKYKNILEFGLDSIGDILTVINNNYLEDITDD